MGGPRRGRRSARITLPRTPWFSGSTRRSRLRRPRRWRQSKRRSTRCRRPVNLRRRRRRRPAARAGDGCQGPTQGKPCAVTTRPAVWTPPQLRPLLRHYRRLAVFGPCGKGPLRLLAWVRLRGVRKLWRCDACAWRCGSTAPAHLCKFTLPPYPWGWGGDGGRWVGGVVGWTKHRLVFDRPGPACYLLARHCAWLSIEPSGVESGRAKCSAIKFRGKITDARFRIE